MKLGHISRKILSTLMISTLLLSYIPEEIKAEDPTEAPTNVNLNVNAKNAQASITTGDKDVDIQVDVNLVQRTMNILDVAKFVNTANTHGIKQDYKPSLKDTLEDSLPEYGYADIVEYEGFTNNIREPITVDTTAESAYASKLEWLIEHNMINRTTYYMYNEDTTYSSMYRTPRPITTDTSPTEEDTGTDTVNKPRFFYPEYKISKTDFLVELMKADKIQESRPIIVQTPYKRLDTNLNTANIKTEPVEESPYTSYLGQLGLDYASNEIVADHTVFNQSEVMATNDVVELYLNAALNKNIITEDEIGGKEGAVFLGERSKQTSVTKDGYLKMGSPIRQFYATTALALHKKILEKDIVYPESLNNYSEVTKSVLNVESNNETGETAPWGNSYTYNTDDYCIFANPVNKLPIEIVKRPSVVDVNNNQYSYTPEVTSIEKDKGYEYFQKEEITVAESYCLTYKLLQAMGDESKLTKTEIEYLNSKYSLNFSNFTEEERTATEYLIAKGIVDGGDSNLYLASSATLSNEDAIDIIYRVANKDARITFSPSMTSIDKEMATKGYSQATITKTTENNTDFELVDDITKGRTVYAVDAQGNTTVVSQPTKTYAEIQNADRVRNPASYDIIYVRLPKYTTDALLLENGYATMITNDEFRATIDPVNTLVNYGKTNVTPPTDLHKGESVYGSEGDFTYAFKDSEGYYWHRYIVHKSLSSKIALQTYTSTGTHTITGIRGEGIYYVDETSDNATFRKVSIQDAKNYTMTSRLYTLIVSSDLKVRNNTYVASAETTKLTDVTGAGPGADDDSLVYVWSQKAYGDPTQASVSSILLGEYPNGEGLDSILFNGGQLLKKDGNNEWVVDTDKIKATTAVKQSIIGVVKDGDKYYLQYQSPYQNSADSTRVDVFNKLSKIGSKSVDSDKESSSPGYAKITSNGETVAIIAQEELAKYNIEVKGETGRMLYNTKTGQRAFINSLDNTVWIGNNVTKYGEDQLMVTATGEGTDKKIYYNLAIIIELINNTKAVLQTAGSEIFVAIGDAGTTSMEGYRLIDITDVSKGSAGNRTKVDTTYVASIDKFKNVYMDLSAINGAGSNFIYYKNVEKDVKALIVYKPNVIYNDITNYDESKGAYKSSSSLTNTVSTTNKIDTSANETDGSQAKRLLLQSIMGVTDKTSVDDLLKGDYILNIFILDRDSSSDTMQKNFNSFVDIITDGNASNLNILKQATTYVSSTFGNDGFAQGNKSVNQSCIAFYTLSAGTSFSSNYDFVTHAASGNLYALINKEGSPYYKALTGVLGTRFYLKTSASGNTLYKTQDYKTLNEKTNRDQSTDVIHMRYKQYYENTPYNYIPLEVYAMVANRSGINLATGSGVTRDVGKTVATNFRSSTDVKLVTSPQESTAKDSNVFLNIPTDKGGLDMCLATMLELPYKTLTETTLTSLLNTATVNDKDKFYNKLYDLICTDFDSVTGDYKIKNAIGNADNNLGSSTGWSYLTKKSAVSIGDTKASYTQQKEQFFQGMWYGLENSGTTQSYYDLKLPTDASSYENYILVAGNASNSGSANHNATFYLADISYNGHAVNLRPINKYSDLPAHVRYYLDKKSGNTALEPTNEEMISNIAVAYGTTEGVVKSTFKKDIRIYYKPTLTVPAGTTLVKIPNDGLPPKDLVLYPNKDIRGLYYPAKDVVNSVLMMAQEKDNAKFLYQLEKGAKVILPNSNESVVKLTDALDASQGGKLRWVKCLTSPATTSTGTGIQYVPANFVTEASLLAKYITNYYGVAIPMAGSVTSGTINLGQIMGPGSYRLPYLSELKFIMSATNDNSQSASKRNYYPAVYELYKNVYSAFGFDPNKYQQKDGTLSYNPVAYSYDSNSDKMYESTSADPAVTMLTLNLPPSLQVEEVTGDGNENVWRVISYWDIENFAVSAEDEIVSYIKSKDTEITSISEILKTIKSQSVDGTSYTDAARDYDNKKRWNGFVSFVVYGIPSVILIIWLYLSVVYVLVFFNWTREHVKSLNQRFGFDLISRFTLGVFSTTDNPPELRTYFIASFLLFFALALLWGRYLLIWVKGLIL